MVCCSPSRDRPDPPDEDGLSESTRQRNRNNSNGVLQKYAESDEDEDEDDENGYFTADDESASEGWSSDCDPDEISNVVDLASCAEPATSSQRDDSVTAASARAAVSAVIDEVYREEEYTRLNELLNETIAETHRVDKERGGIVFHAGFPDISEQDLEALKDRLGEVTTVLVPNHCAPFHIVTTVHPIGNPNPMMMLLEGLALATKHARLGRRVRGRAGDRWSTAADPHRHGQRRGAGGSLCEGGLHHTRAQRHFHAPVRPPVPRRRGLVFLVWDET